MKSSWSQVRFFRSIEKNYLILQCESLDLEIKVPFAVFEEHNFFDEIQSPYLYHHSRERLGCLTFFISINVLFDSDYVRQ